MELWRLKVLLLFLLSFCLIDMLLLCGLPKDHTHSSSGQTQSMWAEKSPQTLQAQFLQSVFNGRPGLLASTSPQLGQTVPGAVCLPIVSDAPSQKGCGLSRARWGHGASEVD